MASALAPVWDTIDSCRKSKHITHALSDEGKTPVVLVSMTKTTAGPIPLAKTSTLSRTCPDVSFDDLALYYRYVEKVLREMGFVGSFDDTMKLTEKLEDAVFYLLYCIVFDKKSRDMYIRQYMLPRDESSDEEIGDRETYEKGIYEKETYDYDSFDRMAEEATEFEGISKMFSSIPDYDLLMGFEDETTIDWLAERIVKKLCDRSESGGLIVNAMVDSVVRSVNK
jgi:hypothetical protein